MTKSKHLPLPQELCRRTTFEQSFCLKSGGGRKKQYLVRKQYSAPNRKTSLRRMAEVCENQCWAAVVSTHLKRDSILRELLNGRERKPPPQTGAESMFFPSNRRRRIETTIDADSRPSVQYAPGRVSEMQCFLTPAYFQHNGSLFACRVRPVFQLHCLSRRARH